MKSQSVQLAILGAGNMGRAIAEGLVNSGVYQHSEIILTNIDEKSLIPFHEKGFRTTTNNVDAVKLADTIILAVKPQMMKDLLTSVSPSVQQNKLIISIAAGLPIRFFSSFFQSNQPIVRVMPNLCAMVNESMSAWVANDTVTREQKDQVNTILSSFGQSLELESEDKMNAVTAISGSGPAHIFLFTELLQKAAVKLGLSDKEAEKLSQQTVKGSARTMSQADKSPEDLRKAVTSKNGTTEAALTVFTKADLAGIVENATKAAAHRALEIENET